MDISNSTNSARSDFTKRRSCLGLASIIILGVGLCAGLVALFVVGLFVLTRPVVDASEQFLALLGQGKIAEAYASTASGLRAGQDEASFARAVKQLGLTKVSSASWHNRQIQNQEGLVEGTLTAKSGQTTPVSIRLVKEASEWKVVGVRCGGVEIATLEDSSLVPPEKELRRMVNAVLLNFNQAVQTEDFTAFYEQLSELWKEQTTPAQLLGAFREFHQRRIDISPIKDLQPRLTPPARVNELGILAVAGYYDTQPSRVRFELEYVHEASAWKLMSISVSVEAEDAAE